MDGQAGSPQARFRTDKSRRGERHTVIMNIAKVSRPGKAIALYPHGVTVGSITSDAQQMGAGTPPGHTLGGAAFLGGLEVSPGGPPDDGSPGFALSRIR
jgi:hypothetical protein